MKTHVPCSLVFFALLLTFAVEHFAFLPPARAQASQVEPQAGAETQRLRGHVPGVLAHLQPIGRLPASDRLKLAIGLPLRNQQALAQLLQQLSDPVHPNYRHYLTPEEFAARFGPTEQDYAAVAAFAQASGLAVTGRHPNRTLLDVSGSVTDIEKALHLTLRVYQHPAETRMFYAPETEPTLDLAVPVLGISGLNNYSLPSPRLHATPLDQLSATTPNSGAGPSGTYMGGDFRAAYLPGVTLTGSGQVVGLLQFDGYTASDITYYESQAGLPNVPLSNVLLDGFSGSPTGSGGEVEVSLDIETAISMAPGLAGVIVYMAGPYGNFHDILNRMATDNLAKQLSCSWYSPGGGPDAVADQIFQQMAAQGQSFFNASGDYDAFTGPVDFPGETPYIVQVGGTTLTTSGPGGAWVSEKVWNWNTGIGSGGGISTRYAIPSFQTDISMTLNRGSTTMRNIPDVALTADNVYVRANGQDYNVGGTSCAAPLWAGFTALINQQAVSSGRPVVGFVNPAVDVLGHSTRYPSCFHDITTGDNTSGSSPSQFYAVAGYDLCTGWGTPAGQTLINALATPDALLISPSALAFSGVVSGPFSPNPGWLTLTNSGTNALSWTLVNTSGWFNLSPTSGTLLPGGAAASVSVSIDSSAKALPAGVYPAVVWVTNQTSGVAQTCSLALSVAGLGMADDFDPGLDLTQWSGFGGVVGSTVLATNYGGSVSASNSLWFGNAGSRFATTIPINTSGGGQIGFCIRLANGPAWPWTLVDNLPAEGVVLECSTNGEGSWTVIGNYNTSAYYNWTGVAMPVPAVAQAPAALFRWRQLSNSGTNYDHWALDNVVIGTGSMAPKIVMDPQSQNVAVGDPASLSVAAVGTAPLSFQWRLNGTSISGATASSLVWTNVHLTDAGTYSVLVSNNVGSVMSSNAILTTYVPVCAPPAQGLVSWWRAENNALDSTSTNNGTLVGNVGYGSGRVGQSFVSDGRGSGVNVGTGTNLWLQSFSVEAWIKRASNSVASFDGNGNGHLLSVGSSGGFAFCIDYTGYPRLFQLGDWGVSATIAITDTNWHHVAVTKWQTSIVFYVDGVSNAAPAYSPTFTFGAAAVIGAWIYNGALQNSFYGSIDELAIYNRALTTSEIQAIYNARSAGKCSVPAPPAITAQPASQSASVGANVTFSVGASGTPLLTYQWRMNGANLPSQTQTSLVLNNVQFTDAGSYSVTVSNAFGSATSSDAVLIVSPASSCAAPPAGIVSWWRAENNALDSVSTNNGTLAGNAAYGAGRVGQGFVFDGKGDGVNVGSGTNLWLQTFSVEAWIKRASNSVASFDGNGNGHLFSVGSSGGFGFCIDYSGYPRLFQLGDWGVSATRAITDTNWHHVAVTKWQSSIVFYVDGVSNAASAYSPTFTFGAAAVIGAWIDNGVLQNSFYGSIDELAVYNRALTSSEIQAIYNAGSGGKCGLAATIQTPPQSQTAQCSSNVSFSVIATGLPPLAYRWYCGTNLILGATNTLVTLTNVGFAQAGNYSVIVTNAYGSATGGPALLTIVDTIPPTIISCASNQTLSVGANCTATLPDLTGQVVATDASGPVTVTQYPPPGTQLRLGTTNVTFTVQDSSGNASVCVSRLTAVDTTPPFIQACVLELTLGFDTNCQALLPDLTGTNYIVASDNCSSVSVAQAPPALTALPAGTNTVLLTVSDSASNQTTRAVAVIVPGAPHIAVPPANLTVVVSSNATLSVLACGAAPLLYQWQHSSTNLLGAATAVLILNNISTNNAGDYRVVITNSFGSTTSAVATLTVLQPPVITRQPKSAVAAPGATVSFFVTAKGLAPLTYQWQKNGTPLAGQTKASLTVSNIQSADFTGYTVGITNTDGGVLSTVAVLTLAASPVINSLSFNSSTFMLTVPTEVGPTYVVEYKNDLEDPGWTVLATVAGTGLSIPITDNGLTNRTRYYRLQVR